MSRTILKIIGVSLLATAGTAAFAEAPPWTYVEAGYLSVDPDNLEGSGDNWFAGGSVNILNNFHAGARYVDGDFADNTSFTYWTFYGGWHGLLGERGDLFAEASWNDVEVENNSDSAIGVNAGIRWQVIPVLELDGIVHWADYEDFSSDPSYEARAIVNVWRIGIGAAVEFGDEADQYNVFARFAFGRH